MNTDRSLNFGILGGAIATLIVWIVSLFGVVVPAEAAAALATVVTGLVAALVPVKPGGAA